MAQLHCQTFAIVVTFIIIAGFVTCDQRMSAVAYLSVAAYGLSMGKGGYVCNHVDYAPRFAGELFGITNTMATIPGMLSPIVNGMLTPNMSQQEWQYVFFLCAAFTVFGAVVFGIFVKGEVEPWAKPPAVEIQLTVDDPDRKEGITFPLTEDSKRISGDMD